MKSKKELRKEILQLRDALTVEERIQKSHKIAVKVVAKKEFIEADKVFLFASYHSEVDTFEIFQAAITASKDVYYPKVIGKEIEFFKVESEADLLEGYRGIREPEASPEKQLQLQPEDNICVIMPGAAFDREGNRIGYGGGYYDKYLQRLESFYAKDIEKTGKHIYKIAVAFGCQMIEIGEIISEPHDIKPDCIVTETSIMEVS